MKEARIEQCYIRMERGEPPSNDIEEDWIRHLRKELDRIKGLAERQKVKCPIEELIYHILFGILGYYDHATLCSIYKIRFINMTEIG